ncbi:hypothetical protein B6I21_05755 [candidate division KSB1 bacterium 4572_119]|nr:MAG: hypothetical protein B6I21_05755 [candidate division KSB1 bacterium 4572_119]
MNVFLFWILIIAFFLSFYLYLIYRRSPKGFRFQVKLTITFILLVLIPAIPLTSFVSALLTRGVEMLLLPGIERSLSNSLDIIRYQLEERGDIFFKIYQESDEVDQKIATGNDIVYYAKGRIQNGSLQLLESVGIQNSLWRKSLIHQSEVIPSLLNGEIKSQLIQVEEGNYFEVYDVLNKNEFRVAAFSVDPKIVIAKDNISESLRIYNSLSLFKKSVVEGQIIWGFSTLLIIIMAVIAIYAAKILSRGISEPIQELTAGMQRVAEGNLDKPVTVKAKDEIKFLVDSFNKMARDLKVSQEKLVQAERLAAWQDVARRVSHEIKNSLTPIQLSIRRIVENKGRKKDSKFDPVETIYAELESLRRFATDFSEFARLPQANLEKDNVNEVIQSIVTLLEAEPGVINFKLKLDKNLPLVNLDRVQFRRALHNIIKNAIESSRAKPSPGEILVETSIVDENQKTIQIKIKDWGEGMEAEVVEKIFEPYYSTKQRGMGLGLAIVKKIIDDHNATIDYKSFPGKGTEVIIVL